MNDYYWANFIYDVRITSCIVWCKMIMFESQLIHVQINKLIYRESRSTLTSMRSALSEKSETRMFFLSDTRVKEMWSLPLTISCALSGRNFARPRRKCLTSSKLGLSGPRVRDLASIASFRMNVVASPRHQRIHKIKTLHGITSMNWISIAFARFKFGACHIFPGALDPQRQEENICDIVMFIGQAVLHTCKVNITFETSSISQGVRNT
jgi:hypothetical protein